VAVAEAVPSSSRDSSGEQQWKYLATGSRRSRDRAGQGRAGQGMAKQSEDRVSWHPIAACSYYLPRYPGT
jgi:hypothetical protein